MFGNDYFTEDADYSISVSLASHPRTTHDSGGRTMRDDTRNSVSWRRNTWLYRQPPFQQRVFSTAGLIVNRLRTRLSPEHVDMKIMSDAVGGLMCYVNWKCFRHTVFSSYTYIFVDGLLYAHHA